MLQRRYILRVWESESCNLLGFISLRLHALGLVGIRFDCRLNMQKKTPYIIYIYIIIYFL
jgi:hypothetical protein